MSGTKDTDHKKRFEEFLASQKLRVTGQRIAIFKAAFETDEHFIAEELLKRAKAIDSSVSRATVYRTIPLLVESSLIREIDVGRDYKLYVADRGGKTFQTQVICADCDKIYEVDAPFMEWYGKTVAEKLGMVPKSQRLQITARCKNAGCPQIA